MGVMDRLRGQVTTAERIEGTAAFIETLQTGFGQLGFSIEGLAVTETTPDHYRGALRLASGLELELRGSCSHLGDDERDSDWISADFFAGATALGGFSRSDELDWQIDLDLKKNLLEQERLRLEQLPELSSLSEEAKSPVGEQVGLGPDSLATGH